MQSKKQNKLVPQFLWDSLKSGIWNGLQTSADDFAKGDLKTKSEMATRLLGNLALFAIPATKIGTAGEAVELGGDLSKTLEAEKAALEAEKATELEQSFAQVERESEQAEIAIEDAKRAKEAGKFANGIKGSALLEESKKTVILAKASQGNSVYTGIDKWLPNHLNAGEIYYRGEPNGTDFFATKESIEKTGACAKKLFEGLQVREDPIHGYRKEMQGYIVNNDLNAAQAKCLANSQFGKGGLEEKYIPNANDLIDKGILIPVDKINLK